MSSSNVPGRCWVDFVTTHSSYLLGDVLFWRASLLWTWLFHPRHAVETCSTAEPFLKLFYSLPHTHWRKYQHHFTNVKKWILNSKRIECAENRICHIWYYQKWHFIYLKMCVCLHIQAVVVMLPVETMWCQQLVGHCCHPDICCRWADYLMSASAWWTHLMALPVVLFSQDPCRRLGRRLWATLQHQHGSQRKTEFESKTHKITEHTFMFANSLLPSRRGPFNEAAFSYS